MEEEVQYCKNCKRDISVKNYVIHSVHCERKIQLCNRCLEPVPRSELEKHEEEFHSKEACSKCGISVEKWQIQKHKETCIKRLIPCKHCELEVPLHQLSEHCVACGSRTEQCSKCSKLVMIKDLEVHHTNCSRTLNFSDSVSCDYYEGPLNNNSIQRHIELCKSQTEKCNECNHYIQKKDMELHLSCCKQKKHLKLELPCQFCGELFPYDFVDDHADICGTRLEKCGKYVSLKNLETHSNMCKESMSKTHGNCPVCHQSIPCAEINVHSAYCAQVYYETSEYEHQNKSNELALKREAARRICRNMSIM
ncbi:unnamed protein product [Larinioides sclopetarius]|uniref:TRAFD1/XAF1 zinc finger domain-containing protein n=1 Tax=Larinioides sclopetarius TaxID=280406 RepID=A0AAV1ZYT7_9ARAC